MQSHKGLIFFIAVITIIFIACLSVFIPLNMADGIDKFEGVQKQAAQKAVQFVEETTDGKTKLTNGPILNFYAAEVRQNTLSSEKCHVTNGSSRYNPESVEYYEVVIKYQTLFGIEYNETLVQGCRQILE